MATQDITIQKPSDDLDDLVTLADSQKFLFSLTKESSLELFSILSAYSDLLDLMDSDLPHYVFLQMLNERFSRFASSLPSCSLAS